MESTIKQEAFFNLSYGVYTLTANCGGKDNGCQKQEHNRPEGYFICVFHNIHPE